MIPQLLILLTRSLFGTTYRRPPALPPIVPTVGEPIEPATPADLDPIPPVPHHEPPRGVVLTPDCPAPVLPPPAPNILVPIPANQDNHGAASSIARAMLRKNHVIFEKDDQPHNLNIVGIRTADPEFDRFRCRLVHFWKHQGTWRMEDWPITTLPGHRYMIDRLLSPLGCAILAEGQYRGVYRLDHHRGIYQALCQRNGSVTVHRDKNRDRVYDLLPNATQTGSYGINIHATENPDDGVSNPVADRIGSASAGCQVFARVADFVEARNQWRMARNYWGGDFTYTLISADELDDPGTVTLEPVAPQHSQAEYWTPPGPATTGTRNRNLLNVKQGRDRWKYSTGQDSRGHAIFPNWAAGIRAGIITLRTYWTKHRLQSLVGITNRWAPATDTVGSLPGRPKNDPTGYASFLAKRMGLSITDQLMTFHPDGTVRSADQLYQLVAAMVEMENGQHVKLPRSVFDEGLALV